MGALQDILALSGIGLMFVGLLASTIAGASIRRRPTLGALGAVLLLAGILLPKALGEGVVAMTVTAGGAVVVLGYTGLVLWRLFRLPTSHQPRGDAQA